MTEAGVPVLLDLVAAGCKVKATASAGPSSMCRRHWKPLPEKASNALVFGTRYSLKRGAARPFEAADIDLSRGACSARRARPCSVLGSNPLALYKVKVA